MDKELLARKLYVERVTALLGDNSIDDDILATMWESKASPAEAAKAMMTQTSDVSSPWLSRYLSRR